MRERPAISWWLLSLIVMLLTGCDNVSWGGAQISVISPPPGSSTATAAEESEVAAIDEQPPTGPVLYYVQALGDQARLTPIAEIGRDTLLPVRALEDAELYSQRFIAQNLRQGTEFALFHHGARAGTFVLQSAELPGEKSCPKIPHATGILELVSSAGEVTEFLAIAKTHSLPGGRRNLPPNLEVAGRMPLQAAILAERVLRGRNARLPNNWARAMTQLQLFPLAGSADPAFASTFVVGDSTGRGANPSGYSLFFIAQATPQSGYNTTFIDFTDYATAGRAVPRVIDFLDWDHSGGTGLLLELRSGQETWFEGIALSNDRWRRVLKTRCDTPLVEETETPAVEGDSAAS